MTVRDVTLEYNRVLIAMLSHIFGVNFRDSKNVKTGIYPFSKDNIVMVQFSGDKLTGELIFAVDNASGEHLLSTVVSRFEEESLRRQLLHSALEELASATSLELKKSKDFQKKFSNIKFQPPVVWDSFCEEACIPFKHGTSGELSNGFHHIETFISFSKAHSIEIAVHNMTESNI